MKGKKIYIVPGFGETTKDAGYKQIMKEVEEIGWLVIPLNLRWERNVTKDWLKQLEDKLDKNNIEESYILGFSLGAYLAILSSKKFNFKEIISCSLSPFFKEDLPFLPSEIQKIMGKNRWLEFQNTTFPAGIKSKICFLIGDKDLPLAIQRTKLAYKTWEGKKELEILENVGHEIENPIYVSKILEKLKKEGSS